MNKIKRAGIIWLAVMLLGSQNVWAAEIVVEDNNKITQGETPREAETKEEPQTETESEDVIGVADTEQPGADYKGPFLKIDNSHVYKGMDKTFQEGYTPSVKKDQATLVVPFLEVEKIKGGKLRAEIDLGDASSAPFIFKNYDTTLEKKSYEFAGESVFTYLLTIKLELNKERQTGSYPIKITLGGRGENGKTISEVFTFYITVDSKAGSGQNQDGGDSGNVQDIQEASGGEGTGPRETELKPQPKVILQKLEPVDTPLLAGVETQIKATFLNTNPSSYIQNITVSIGAEGNTMLFDKKSFYINKVSAGDTFSVDFKATVLKETTVSTDKLTFAIDYNDSKAAALTETEDFMIQIGQPVMITMENLDIPADVYAAETIPVSMKIINLSRVKVYNVRYTLAAEGLMPKESAFIGNMEAGSASTGTISVFIGTKDLVTQEGDIDTDGSGEKYGRVNGKVTVSYEDEFGKEYSEQQEFTTNLNKPEILTPVLPKQKTETAGQWWISILAAMGGVGFMLSIMGIRKYVLRKADAYEK